jgi:hypothetical protein
MYMELIQEALVAAGYDPGPIDGMEGPLTRAAIAAFQADQGLAADGIVGPLTHAALFRGDVPVAGADSDTCVSADDDGQLTAHFNREEFRCCCEGRYCDGFPAEMQADLLMRLEAVRVALGAAVIVTSGVRCPLRNQEVGGIPHSRHLVGAAVDCYAPDFSVFDLAEAAEQQGLGVIIYEEQGFCHLEI